MAGVIDLTSLEKDPRLFLYTSLTAGSSHIITATSRMETILKANRIPFQAIDIATDPKARSLWQRRGAKRRLPGLVKDGYVIGDLNEVEEWNEFGELKENIGPVPAGNVAPPGGPVGVNIAPPLSLHGGPSSSSEKLAQPISDNPKPERIALPAMAEIAALNKAKAEAAAAQRAKEKEEAQKQNDEAAAESQSIVDETPDPETMISAATQKQLSIEASKKATSRSTPKEEEAEEEDKGSSSAAPDSNGEESVSKSSHELETTKVSDPVEDELPEKDDEAEILQKSKESTDAQILPQDDKVDDSSITEATNKVTKEANEVKSEKDIVEKAKGIEAAEVGTGTKTQEQTAAKAEESAKSVED